MYVANTRFPGRQSPLPRNAHQDSSSQSEYSEQSSSAEQPHLNIQDDISLNRSNSIVRAAKRVDPAVVSLSIIQVVQTRSSAPFGSDFWDYFFLPPPAREREVLSLGSGVIINPEGYILTNFHVVEGAHEIKVTLKSGDEYTGKIVGSDPVSDLAVIKINSESRQFPHAPLGNSDDLIIGEWAIAIGNPFGYLLDDTQPTVTVGVISATRRDIKPGQGQIAVYRKMIQTDAAINPGNSGGPLVNALGEVIGINTFIFTSSKGSEGIGFAIPINRAKMVIADILKYGEVLKGWVGLQVTAINQRIAQSLNLDRSKGIVVAAVSDNSPAARAGLKAGDVLISVGKSSVETVGDWDEIVNYSRPGRALPVNIIRENKSLSLVLVPEEIPLRKLVGKTDKFGLEIGAISLSAASYLGIESRNGVVVLNIKENAAAGRWGFQYGDIIRRIGRRNIDSVDDYLETVSQIGPGLRVVFTIERQGETLLLQVIT